MAFIGYPLADDKTDGTVADDDHALHHNALAAAANALQVQVDAAVSNANGRVSKTGSQTMAGPLTSTGGFICSSAPASGTYLANKTYVDGLINTCIRETGAQAMVGPLTSTNGFLCGTAPPSGSYLANKTYVDGLINTCLRETGSQSMSGTLSVSGHVLSGNPSTVEDTAGNILWASGGLTAITVSESSAGASLDLYRMGTGAAAVGQFYAIFRRTTSATAIGSITIASASSVGFNTTSDPRLKSYVGDIDDATDQVRHLGSRVFRGRWIADEGEGKEWAFMSSNDVEDVAPYAVHGVRGAVLDDGSIDPQQVNLGALVPLLFAGLSQALDRIEALEVAA